MDIYVQTISERERESNRQHPHSVTRFIYKCPFDFAVLMRHNQNSRVTMKSTHSHVKYNREK